MGADVHIYLEKYNSETLVWEKIPRIRMYDDRDYSLFSLLAGVRGQYKPFKQPKGIPEDVSKGILKCIKNWGTCGHSHSWYGLKELIDHPRWDIEHTERLNVTDKEYIYYKKHNKLPEKYKQVKYHYSNLYTCQINSEQFDNIYGKRPVIKITHEYSLYYIVSTIIDFELTEDWILKNFNFMTSYEIALILKYQNNLSLEFKDSIKMLSALKDIVELPMIETEIETRVTFPLKYLYRKFYFGFLKKLEKRFGNTDDVRLVFFFDS